MCKPIPLHHYYHKCPLVKRTFSYPLVHRIPRPHRVGNSGSPTRIKLKQEREKQATLAAKGPQLIAMDSIYLKLNIKSNPTICAVRERYPRLQRFHRVQLFERFPASERPIVHTTLRNVAAKLSPFEAYLTPRSQVHQERKQPLHQKVKMAVGFGLDAPTLAAIFTYLVSQFRPVMEARWQRWPEPYVRYAAQNWKYTPLVAVGSPVEDIADSLLEDLQSMCRDGAGTALIEGFIIRPERNKLLNPPVERAFGDIGVPFTAPFDPWKEITALEPEVSNALEFKPSAPCIQT